MLLALASPALAVDFKGVEIGEPLWRATEKSVFGTLDCNPEDLGPEEYERYMLEMQSVVPGVRKVCAATTSIATIPADATVLLGPSRRVLRLTFQFPGEHYARVVGAMQSKWGEGVIEVRDEVDQSIWWDFEGGMTVSAHQVPAAVSDPAARLSVGLVEYSLPVETPESDL